MYGTVRIILINDGISTVSFLNLSDINGRLILRNAGMHVIKQRNSKKRATFDIDSKKVAEKMGVCLWQWARHS